MKLRTMVLIAGAVAVGYYVVQRSKSAAPAKAPVPQPPVKLDIQPQIMLDRSGKPILDASGKPLYVIQ